MKVPPTNRPTVPPGIELIRLRTTMSYALEVIRDVELYAEQAADVVRRVDADYAAGLDQLRQHLKDGQVTACHGSPAAILGQLAQLIGEA